MTTQPTINIRSTNIPPRESIVGRIVSGSQVNVVVRNVMSDFIVHISPLVSDQVESLLLTRLSEILPRRMSRTHVEQLRARFPQPPAMDDPATFEFETD